MSSTDGGLIHRSCNTNFHGPFQQVSSCSLCKIETCHFRCCVFLHIIHTLHFPISRPPRLRIKCEEWRSVLQISNKSYRFAFCKVCNSTFCMYFVLSPAISRSLLMKILVEMTFFMRKCLRNNLPLENPNPLHFVTNGRVSLVKI